MSNHKDRVQRALELHHEKLHKKQSNQRHKRNGKPEKEVEYYCLKWMREEGFDVQIVESKATYNPRAGRYLRNSSVSTGTCDCFGTDPNGHSVFVEFKAPTRLSTFAADKNAAQRDYLISKIMRGAFATVTDSKARLEKIYREFLEARKVSPDKAKQLLLDYLPKQKTP